MRRESKIATNRSRRESQQSGQSLPRTPENGKEADLSEEGSPGGGLRAHVNAETGQELEKSVDDSVNDTISDVQAQPWVRHDEPDSDESDESRDRDQRAEDVSERRMYHVQKRASGLSVVSRTKVLRGVPTRLQVLFARQLKCVYFGTQEEEVLCRAGDSSPHTNRFMVLDDGVADVLVPGPDGSEIVIGKMGPGSVIGGTLALGLTSTHLMTIRRARVGSKGEQPPQDEASVRPVELITHVIHGNDIMQLEDQFKDELDVLRKRVLGDLHRFVVPHLQRMSSHGFFRRYCSAFVKRVVKNMDMRICRPSELIFKEHQHATSMAILFCGKIDIFVSGKYASTQGEPGMTFGEAALLEDNAVRAATVRCSSEADCLICLLQKQDFLEALNAFPEEKNRLEEQVKTKLTRLSMTSIFANCERNFLHFLSAIVESVEMGPDLPVYSDSETLEALYICQRGELVVTRPGDRTRKLQKGEAIGFEGAIGLRRGPPDYTLTTGPSGCLLICLSYKVLEKALIYFPAQLPAVLQVCTGQGITDVPDDHPFKSRQNSIWSIIQPLLCQAFMTLDIDESLCRTLAPFFKPEICDPGCTITEEGKESDVMVLLIHGSVNWSTSEKVTTVANAPRHFDEGLVMGTQRRHTATITAKSTCILWLLSAEHVAEMKTRHWSVCKIFEEAAALRRSMQLHLQARLRNMKTFRRFRSEILEIISRNMDIRTFLPKAEIFTAGDEGDCMYILLQGKAEATVNGRIGQLEEGSTFGEMCLFGQVKRTMTVSSATLCICNVVHRDIITYAFTQFPDDKNASRDYAGPSRSRGPSIMGRAKASEEKLFSKKNSKRESRREFEKQLKSQEKGGVGASRISLRTLDACARDHFLDKSLDRGTPRGKGPGMDFDDGKSPRMSVRRSLGGGNSREWAEKRSRSSGDIMSRSSIRAAERKSTRATFFSSTKTFDEESPSTSSSSDSSSPEDGRAHMVKYGRTSWIKSPKNGPRGSDQHQLGDLPSPGSRASVQRDLEADFTEDELSRDAQAEEQIAGPKELQRRFQHRSCLFDVPTPKVPPADETLYYAKKDAEEKLSRVFRGYMPAGAAAMSARVHGVPSASRREDDGSRQFEPGSGMNESSIFSGTSRKCHVGATYTSPLPPIHHTRPPGSAVSTGVRPKEGERSIALAGNLQILASSLLRINNKPTLTSKSLEEMQKNIVEDTALQAGLREYCRDIEAGTWSESDSSDEARVFWGSKRNNKASREASTEDMRALSAPMMSRVQKHAHLKRSYLALPITPSMPKKPKNGKQRPYPAHIRISQMGIDGESFLPNDGSKDRSNDVAHAQGGYEAEREKQRDVESAEDRERDKHRQQKAREIAEMDEATAHVQACFFVRKTVFKKVAPARPLLQTRMPTLPIDRVSDKYESNDTADADHKAVSSSADAIADEATEVATAEATKGEEAKAEEDPLQAENLKVGSEGSEQQRQAESDAAEDSCRAEELQRMAQAREEARHASLHVRSTIFQNVAQIQREAPDPEKESAKAAEAKAEQLEEASDAPRIERAEPTEEHPAVDKDDQKEVVHSLEPSPAANAAPDEVKRARSMAPEEEDVLSMVSATCSFIAFLVVKVSQKIDMEKESALSRGSEVKFYEIAPSAGRAASPAKPVAAERQDLPAAGEAGEAVGALPSPEKAVAVDRPDSPEKLAAEESPALRSASPEKPSLSASAASPDKVAAVERPVSAENNTVARPASPGKPLAVKEQVSTEAERNKASTENSAAERPASAEKLTSADKPGSVENAAMDALPSTPSVARPVSAERQLLSSRDSWTDLIAGGGWQLRYLDEDLEECDFEDRCNLDKAHIEEAITVQPDPCFVVKTYNAKSGQKVFLNVVSSEHVEAPRVLISDNIDGEEGVRVPLRVGTPEEDFDKKQEPCVTYDVMTNPDTLVECLRNQQFMDTFVNLSLACVSQKFEVELSSKYTLPKMATKYKGKAVRLHRIPKKTWSKTEEIPQENIVVTESDEQVRSVTPLQYEQVTDRQVRTGSLQPFEQVRTNSLLPPSQFDEERWRLSHFENDTLKCRLSVRSSLRSSARSSMDWISAATERAERYATGFCVRRGCYRFSSRKQREEDHLLNDAVRYNCFRRVSGGRFAE